MEGWNVCKLEGIDMPEVARWITVSFWRPIGNREKLLYTYICCMAAVLCHGGELLMVHLCGEVLSFTAPPRRCYVDQPYNGSTHCSSQILNEGVRASFSTLNVRNVSTFLVFEEKNGIPQSTVSCNGRMVSCEPGRSWLYLSFNFANAFISCFV